MYLSPSNGAIVKPNSSNSLAFTPSSFSINSSEPFDFTNRIARSKSLGMFYFADDLEFHGLPESYLKPDRFTAIESTYPDHVDGATVPMSVF